MGLAIPSDNVTTSLHETGIAVAITTFNNHRFLGDNIPHLLSSSLVREIVISDDRSETDAWKLARGEVLSLVRREGFRVSDARTDATNRSRYWGKAVETFTLTREFEEKRIIWSRNAGRLGGFRNKGASVSLSNQDWVLLLDADNIVPKESLAALASLKNIRNSEVFCPSQLVLFSTGIKSLALSSSRRKQQLGLPRLLHGKRLNQQFFRHLLSRRSPYLRAQASFFLNTGNFLVNRETYRVCVGTIERERASDPMAADVVAFASKWLRLGGAFVLVKDFKYLHRLHEDSFWASTASGQEARAEERTIRNWSAQKSNENERTRFALFNALLRARALPFDFAHILRRLRKRLTSLPVAFRRKMRRIL